MSDAQETPSLKPFFVIWSGQAVSLLGSQLVQFGIIWWLTKTTGSSTVLALASLAGLLPMVVLGPFAGALVDRWNRRRVMIFADTGSALASLALALLFWTHHEALWMVYLALVVRAAAGAFHWPAMQASVTLLVPQKHLARAAGLNQALNGASGILMPPLGALAVETLSMQAILAVDVFTALPAVLCLVFTAIPQPPRAAPQGASGKAPSLWADLRAGLQYILAWRGLALFALVGILIGLLGRAAGSLAPLMVTQHFGGGAPQLAAWQSAGGIGAILAGLALGVWGGGRRRLTVSMLALALDGLVIAFIALCPQPAFFAAVIGVGLSDALETTTLGLNGAIGQSVIPPEMQGRVFSLVMSASMGLAPLGLLAAGPVADAFGVQVWWLLTGILIALVAAGALLFPEVVHLEDPAYRRSPAGAAHLAGN